ncbi:hypothetical protein GCM10027062_35620 [Nocardioides hungaricus]
MKRILLPLSAAALAGTVLPLSASAPPASGAPEPGFGGYSAVATAAPVKIELYEPTIPIPATPQFEVEMGYTTVEADSGSSLGRASWLWPGDPVGEGMKTFVEQLGLPPQLGEDGYPVQVNSGQPSGEPAQADEPFPGMVMRTSATADKTVAQAGFSPDGQVQDGTAKDGGDEGTPGVPTLPGVPGLPELPGLPGADLLSSFGDAITGGLSTAAEQPEEPAPGGAPGIPPEVAALVDFEGYTSSSQSAVVKDGRVVTTARSALGDVTLLGGLITMEGIVSTSTSSSDGAKGTASGRAVLGGLTIAGQEFSAGPGGFTAAGQEAGLPAFPDQLTQALDRLGIKLLLPKPDRTVKGDQATNQVAGLILDIDVKALRKQLDALPLDDLIGALPDNPPELKSTLQALAGLAPRVVVTLGVADTEVDTVKGLTIPTDVPDNNQTGPGGTGGGAGTGGAPAGGAPSSSAPGAAAGDAPEATGDLPPAQLTGSGLPPLYSLPGALLVGGIALAALGGTWLRRIGVIALGGAGSCSHGLDSGLPDLRKAS